MKSYILEQVTSRDASVAALRRVLPGQEHPWLLLDPTGDPVAYFNIVDDSPEPDLVVPAVQVDISGRHYNSDLQVLEVIRALQAEVGGYITYSP
jgi:hypothetical protein